MYEAERLYIPVKNLTRAVDFYNAVFFSEPYAVEKQENGFQAAFYDAGGIVYSLIRGKDYTPSESGILIYINVGSMIDEILAEVELHCGSVSIPKTKIEDSEKTFAIIIDSEGNRVGLYSP